MTNNVGDLSMFRPSCHYTPLYPSARNTFEILLNELKLDHSSQTLSLLSCQGYLSITDWPLLPFYSVMCAVYVVLGLCWLVACSMHWREILRLQFWIGGVIFLGMVEKAMFTAEYQNIHNSGKTTQSLILAAEIVSCAKRSIAR